MVKSQTAYDVIVEFLKSGKVGDDACVTDDEGGGDWMIDGVIRIDRLARKIDDWAIRLTEEEKGMIEDRAKQAKPQERANMATPTLQTIIVAGFQKQAGRPHTDVDPLVDGKIFLTGTFDINAIVAEIEMWALGGQVGMDKIRELLTKSNAG